MCRVRRAPLGTRLSARRDPSRHDQAAGRRRTVAAASSNLQPWSVVAVEDSDRKARLAAFAGNQTHIAQAPLFLVWLIDLHRLESIGRKRAAPTEGLDYLETLLLGSVDTAMAAQNAVVALESLGLGAVCR